MHPWLLHITEKAASMLLPGDRRPTASIPSGDFVSRIVQHYAPPDEFFPIPFGVRFYKFVGSSVVVVVELEPSIHAVRWIQEVQDGDQAAHVGSRAKFDNRTLALPYTVLILPFSKGMLQVKLCQVFYRNAPLKSWDDALSMTNLLNVAEAYGFTSWLCMVGYAQRSNLSWAQAISEAVRYFLWSAFNRSSEVHEMNSHYGTLRRSGVDPRIVSAAEWEEASKQDSRFMLEIAWPATGHTVRSAFNLAFSKLPKEDISLPNLIQGG